MAVDKNKIIAEATRFVQKGSLDKAIKSYERILEEDPKDVRVQLKIAELHQKKGDDARAADVFRRAAETYAEQGFFLKAVAVFKQVAKLNPADLGVSDRLAGLYQQLGLMSDAAGQLQLMAAGYEKAGDPVRLLEVLRRMVEFDPENVAAIIKIGELHQRANQAGPALDHFRRAAEALKRSGRTDEYLRVAERIASLAPDDLSLTRELANLYLARNDTKRALSKLQICFQAAPKDVDTLELLAKAFQDLGQTTKRVSVFKELARVHEERGRSGDARAVWRRLREIAPDDPDAAAALGPAAAPAGVPSPSPRGAPAPPPPLMARAAAPAIPPPAPPLAFGGPPAAPSPRPPAAPAAAAAPPGPEAIPKLLTETDVYLKYGLHEKALDHLRRILAIDPDSPQAHEKIRDVSEASGGHPAAIAAGEAAIRACLAKGLQDRARENLARLQQLDPNHPRLAELAGAVGATEEIGLEGNEVLDDAVDAEEPEEVELVPDEVREEVGEGIADGALLASPSGAPQLELIEDEPLGSDDDLALQLAADPLDERVIDEEAAAGVTHGSLLLPLPEPEPGMDLQPGAAPASASGSGRVSELEPELEEPPDPFAPPPPPAVIAAPIEVPDAPAPAPAAAAEAETEVDLSEELEEVDFFLEQGLLEEARDALGNLRAFYPDHPGVAARLEEVDLRARAERTPPEADRVAGSGDGPAPVVPPPPAIAASPVATSPAIAPAPAPPESPSPGELDRVHETPPLVTGGALEGGSIDIGAELGDLLGEATAAGGPAAADDFQYSVEDVFNQFKKGVAETVKAEDSETHYDLGIAYKEMGLLDDAVQEFETAIRGTNRRKEVDCLSMIGLCRMAQGRPRDAADALRRALRSDYLSRDSGKAIHHDLGAAHEALGEPQAALWYYQKVLKVDPAYRDLSARVAALGGGPGAPPEGEAPAPVAPPTPAPGPAVGDRPAARPAPLAAVGGNKKNIGFL